MTAIVLLAAAALDAAALGDVLCAEARGLPEREQLAIAQVARNRARAARTSIRVELARPGQWAKGCPARLHRPLAALAARFIAGMVRAPRWAGQAVAFATPKASRRVEKTWRARGLVPMRGTRTVHVFWRWKVTGRGKHGS